MYCMYGCIGCVAKGAAGGIPYGTSRLIPGEALEGIYYKTLVVISSATPRRIPSRTSRRIPDEAH